MTWAFTVKGISYKSSFSIIKPFLCNLKGKENQNKKITDFEYLNYFEYVSHCVIAIDLLYFLPDFKAEKKKYNFERWKGEVARLHSLVL